MATLTQYDVGMSCSVVGLRGLDQVLGAVRMDSRTVAMFPHVSYPLDEG